MLHCRSCNAEELQSIIPLGSLPIANALLHDPDVTQEERHNLEVLLCSECGLAQLKDVIDPKALFTHYVYFSSNADTMLESAQKLVQKWLPRLPIGCKVVEIASNDGYLLKNYLGHDIEILGIDPAENICVVANAQGIPTLCRFFNVQLAEALTKTGKKAHIIHANNVMAHVPDINDFIRGIKELLHEEGAAIIEVPYFLNLVRELQFDTIYHEHVFYFSVKPLQIAFERYDLEIYDIEQLNLHGGTLRLFVGHKDRHPLSPLINEMIQKEEEYGIYDPATFSKFMHRVNEAKQKLSQKLKMLKQAGGKLAAYGASAKGTTLLNYFGITQEVLEFVVDRSAAKIGLYTPGTRLPIYHPDYLSNEKITHALLLTWNFADEIMSQQQEFIQRGGQFILPVTGVFR